MVVTLKFNHMSTIDVEILLLLLMMLLLLLLRMLLLKLVLVLLLWLTILLTLTLGVPPPALAGATCTCPRGSVTMGSAVGFGPATTAPPCVVCGGVVETAATGVAAGECRRTSTATESASRSQLVASSSACPVKA